jgi:anaerobic magnesium-protoporphyrin IX monomethyl ester cyclase
MIVRKKRIVLYHPQFADASLGETSAKDVLPLSLLTIAAWPLADGYEVVLVDGCLYPQEEAHRRVLEACEGAMLYGTTGMLSFQVADGVLCSRKVKARLPHLPMFIGGWFASVVPELQLETGLYDAVALGQGEITFREIVQAVDAGEPLDAIPGLALRRDGRITYTPHREVVGWDRLLNCPWHLIDFDIYREQQIRDRARRPVERLPRPPSIPEPEPFVGIAYFGSFGCPEPCAFCCSPEVTGMRWKAMPAERMLDDIEELCGRWRFDVLRFHDANWGVSEKRMREFAEGKLARGLRFQYFPMMQSFSVLRSKPATLDLLAESGLYVAQIGAEAGSDEMMRQIGKHTSGDDNLDAAVELDRRGVTTWLTYIIGYPDEGVDSMLATLDQARRIRAACPLSHPAVWPFHPIPGTPMYRRALELGFVPPKTLEQWGSFNQYHLEATWPGRIPALVWRRRKLFQHLATLSHGLARGRIGWWERRAIGRLRSGNLRFASLEAKAFDLWQGLGRRAPAAGGGRR